MSGWMRREGRILKYMAFLFFCRGNKMFTIAGKVVAVIFTLLLSVMCAFHPTRSSAARQGSEGD